MGIETIIAVAAVTAAGSSVANGIMGATQAGKQRALNREMLAQQQMANRELLDLSTTHGDEQIQELTYRLGEEWKLAVEQSTREVGLIASQGNEALSRLSADERANLALFVAQTNESKVSGIGRAADIRTTAVSQLTRATDLTKTQLHRGTDLLIGQAQADAAATERQIGERLAIARETTALENEQVGTQAKLASEEAVAQQQERERRLRSDLAVTTASAAGRGVDVGSGSVAAVRGRQTTEAAAIDRAAMVQAVGRQSLYQGQIALNNQQLKATELEGAQAIENAKRNAGDTIARQKETRLSGDETAAEQLRSGTETADLTYAQAAERLREEARQSVTRQTLDSNQRIGAATMENRQSVDRAASAAQTQLENLAGSINAKTGAAALDFKQQVEEGETRLKWSDVLGALDVKQRNSALSYQGVSSLVSGFGGAASSLYSLYRYRADTRPPTPSAKG